MARSTTEGVCGPYVKSAANSQDRLAGLEAVSRKAASGLLGLPALVPGFALCSPREIGPIEPQSLEQVQYYRVGWMAILAQSCPHISHASPLQFFWAQALVHGTGFPRLAPASYHLYGANRATAVCPERVVEFARTQAPNGRKRNDRAQRCNFGRAITLARSIVAADTARKRCCKSRSLCPQDLGRGRTGLRAGRSCRRRQLMFVPKRGRPAAPTQRWSNYRRSEGESRRAAGRLLVTGIPARRLLFQAKDLFIAAVRRAGPNTALILIALLICGMGCS